MKNTWNAVKSFVTSEDGPTAVEYAVVVALIIIAAVVGIGAVGTALNTWFQGVGDSIDAKNPAF
ncbi:MAG: Flp family type IVb pilin [Candidatus Omnitrophota bacterium]